MRLTESDDGTHWTTLLEAPAAAGPPVARTADAGDDMRESSFRTA
jgi:hypothetical protein